MDPLEERVRRLLSDDHWQVPGDPEALDRVHAGAARRRTRRAIAAGSLAAAVVLVGVGGTATLVSQRGPDAAVALRTGPTATGTSDASGPGRTGAAPTGPNRTTPGQPAPATAPTTPAGTQPPGTGPGAGTGNAPSPSHPTTGSRGPAVAAVPPDFAAESVSAVDPQRFWILGSGPDSNAATVAATTDGGDSFEAVGTIDAKIAGGTNEEGADTVHDLRFADTRHGWAYGGALWSTHDGGRSWQRIDTVKGTVNKLAAGDGQVFALVHDGARWGVWRSSTATDGWARLDVTLLDPADLVVGDGVVAVTDHSGDATYVQVSADGGDTFARQPTDCVPELTPGTMSATRDALWLVCPTGMSASRLAVSTDQGRTWTAVDPGVPGIPGTVATVGAIAADDGLVAAPGEVRLTTPGSDQPDRIRVPGLDSPTFAGFTTADVGYILDADGELYRTTDGGRSWYRVSFSH